ncbi:MAG: YcjF family protein [Gemmata sp.]
MSRLWNALKRTVTGDASPPPDVEATLAAVRDQMPAPVFWLLGKTQSGKTSLVRFLTGAEDAAIGSGFRPCTKSSRLYQFPTPDAPLLTFLDTRGVDEPGYDPTEDLAQFDSKAHVVVVTAKATDFAQGNVRHALERIRAASRSRPVVLIITCLNEAIPRQPHPDPYPFGATVAEPAAPLPEGLPEQLRQCIDEHRRAFAGLYDACVPVDLTKPEDGFADPNYGGERLKEALLTVLPSAYRQTLLRLKEATDALKDAHQRHAEPIILGYTSLAGTAGAVPVPFADMVLLPGIQAKMAHHIGQIYGQPMTLERLRELAAAIGIGVLSGQLVRQAVKFIPVVGSAVGATAAAASTYALGRALCFYFEAVCEGHIPTPDALRKFYHEHYDAAEKRWKADHPKGERPTPEPPP